ncbi:DNA repair protein REV1-like isoform X2 [Rutidosis leptorrhynchoides]|uniref:DNA repair protein REV1-like isoform X2 n=1 Tax=Rutidosis leptorrhynchoides TaxID=125765 RepID=UPI003A996693
MSAVKNRKLHQQFEAEASTSSHGVFDGVSIFVDGYTVPSSQELRSYMLKHGGRFENYFSRQLVTHIICSNLPSSKLKNFRAFSRGLPVVKPTWVLDSVVANKLLNWEPYQLDQLASETNKQPKLVAFLGLRSNPISADVADMNIHEVNDSAEDMKQQPNQESECFVSHSCNESKVEEPTCNDDCELEVAELNEVMAEMQSKCSPGETSASARSCCSNTPNNTESLSMVPVSSNKGSFDPNFVENYFKNSRLHFIGTWRNRYRKRFPSSSDGFRPSSSVGALSTCQRNTILHIDMDSFFVSVVIRNRPELWDKPVAVCHSDNPRGTSEISSANYPARRHGVRAGIFVRDAKALCPHLVIVPYNFEAYEEVADEFYSILHRHCKRVQAMSCDEAFLDITDIEVDDPEVLASQIRKEISDTTGCTASVGISSNMLLARLATTSAKPDGQCYLPPEKVNDFLYQLPIKELPGIGRALEEKLKGRHVRTCGELRMISKESLQKDFGLKTGDMLWNYCRGVDNRLVGMMQETKSVGADLNWGVRFKDLKDCQAFLLNLCKEVSFRLHGCGLRGRTFTLKVKRRKSDEEPVKYMGCGDCDNLSHSLTVPMATDDVDVLQRITKQIFNQFHIDVREIRGVGLHVTKLENADNIKPGNERSSIRSWLVSSSFREKDNEDTKVEQISDIHESSRKNSTVGATLSNRETSHNSDVPVPVPPLSDLDSDVLESLPADILSEINDLYGGKLKTFMSKKHNKSESSGGGVVGTSSIFPGAGGMQDNVGVMPSSLSQIDASVLEQLPEEIRDDILGGLLVPAHTTNLQTPPPPPQRLNHVQVESEPMDDDDDSSSNHLWIGRPPEWVNKFKFSGSQILRFLSDTYNNSGLEKRGRSTSCDLSWVLLKAVSAPEISIGGTTTAESSSSAHDDTIINFLCDLFKQYIQLKLESDLEEIHTCFRLLRRLSVKSKLFLQVYNTTIGQLQMTVSKKYGASLHI